MQTHLGKLAQTACGMSQWQTSTRPCDSNTSVHKSIKVPRLRFGSWILIRQPARAN